jgi:hypothetical protein
MIDPGGLLLVVPHLFAVPVSVLLVGLQKSTLLNLDVKNILSTAGDALISLSYDTSLNYDTCPTIVQTCAKLLSINVFELW